MSCNGCRVLRKGCSDNCMLRQCLQWIDNFQAQANATVFVAKFFGRAGLMSFISSVPESQRPSLFQSLLFEAVGRTVNPVSGAVGLLWTGNWKLCQSAVETVLCGGALMSLPDLSVLELDEASESAVNCSRQTEVTVSGAKRNKRKRGLQDDDVASCGDLDLKLKPSGLPPYSAAATPSEEEQSETTTENCSLEEEPDRKKLLRLFF